MHAPIFTPRRLVIFSGLVLLVGISWWLRESTHLVRGVSDILPPDRPDYYMKAFKLRAMDEHGQLRHQLGADTMAHYPQDDTIRMDAPRVVVYREAAPEWVIEAERGVLENPTQTLWLEGEVKVSRPGVGDAVALQIEARDLRVDLEQQTATTEQAISATQVGIGRASAAGMRLDLQYNRLALIKQVQFLYEAQNP